ncbi:MAG: hypothetical protein OXJ53_06915 [Gammaproteobacteria bacterium]|nr:hypothetical protein [Gammaproteobacteria bacterium]MDD9961673.1 hypothetical protein [Gammaproteobacteria bacterium]MDE0271170.1 hypothetical protein [Gammaproteobacteria bacterium]
MDTGDIATLAVGLAILGFLWSLHRDMAGLHRDMAGLRERMAKLEGTVSGLQTNMAGMQSNVNSLLQYMLTADRQPNQGG